MHAAKLLFAGLAAVAGLMVPGASGANLLSDADFNAPLAGSWTTWTYGGGWANRQTDASSFDGSYYMACGGANQGSSGGGLYQTVTAPAGYVYTLTVDSGVQAWWWPQGEMRLFFLDQLGQGLQTNVLDVTTGVTNYDTGLAWSNYTLSATAPAGTVQVKVEFASQSGSGTVWFDNAVLSVPVATPDISGLYPNGNTLLQSADHLSFTATSGSSITNIQVILNGVDVSSALTITGTSTSKNVSVALNTNQAYTAAITIADANGFSIVRGFTFDTYSPAEFSWEAEDYDINSGSFILNPVLSSLPGPNNYYQQMGSLDIDYHDVTGNGDHTYRPFDYMATEVTADVLRQTYLDAQVSDPAVADYDISYFDAGEWLNYTRNFPSGTYNVYARMSSPGAASLNLSRVTAGWGTSSQTTVSIGNFELDGGLGWATFSWAPLLDASGNLVKLTLGGTNTLRATSSGNCNLQFFLLVPANTNLPTITGLYPNGAIQFQPTNQLSFTAQSAAGINDGSIQVTLYVTNAVLQYSTNLTSTNGLVLTGPATSRTVQYTGLTSNTVYRAVVSVTDINNNTATSTVKFDTYRPVLTWEAEDWDYNYGQHIDNPPVDAYANLAGVEGVDYHDINASGGTPYRTYDAMSAETCGDVPRAQYVAANTNDYALGWFVNGEWVNYTRTIPAGTYNIYGRFSAGDNTSVQSLSLVTNGVGGFTQELQPIGTFTIASTGAWGNYAWTPLRDAFGNLATVTLSGVKTLRLTKTGGSDANANFFMLLPAETGLPTITAVVPGTLLDGFRHSTNRLTFTAASTAGIPTGNIVVTLNGVDVSAALALSGSSTSWNATYSGLAPDTGYTAVITITDNNGLSASTTLYFDTFSTANYTWEAEDWDYNNAQFVDNPQTNAYLLLAGVAGVDYLDSTNGGAQPYRDPSNTAATEAAGDYLRPAYNQTGFTDYDLGYTATGEWENYTRTYPTGTFNVYMRAARGADGIAPMGLSRVTSGRGTPTQTTELLGTFNVGNTGGWQIYLWVPLRDSEGNLVNVSLAGLDTLRLTDGGANVNFFALTPALLLKASLNGGMRITFGTQPGFDYTVQYKASLKDATWTPLTTLPGDGTIKSVNDPLGGTRFYRLYVH